MLRYTAGMKEGWQQLKELTDKWTRDKRGHVVLWQRPNLSIVVWFVAMVLAWVFTGRWEHLAHMVSFGALFAWAWMEIFQGVNMFRRGLGVLIMLVTLINTLN